MTMVWRMIWTVAIVWGTLMGLLMAEPQVPCYFIFGDSLVDSGNNNDMPSLARANYAPYGIDFPDGPTGRFSNGKTTTDVIAELLGFENFIPPYSTTKGEAILSGANFASAAAGIREETGQQLGQRISFDGQIQNYKSAVSQIVSLLGDEKSAAKYLSKCIYTVGMGSNDYLNNYFLPTIYSTSSRYTVEEYANVLVDQYTGQLKTLYDYGARKVAVIGVGQIGCTPNELAQQSPNGVLCVGRINKAIEIFNKKLIAMVNSFNANMDDAKFTYINSYGMLRDVLAKPEAYGFNVTNEGCCGVGRNNGQITCLPLQTPCADRDKYLFWDAFHPSEAGNLIFGRRSYSAASRTDAHPVDIRRLAQL
ncbi:GDSL esterase/lipase At4g18970-like [Wolffia australiana]